MVRPAGRSVLLLFTLCYLAFAIAAAIHRPFWNDELFTFYIARAPTVASLAEALRTGADQHPMPFYLVERWSAALIGWNELGLRLPSLLAGWVIGICSFALGTRYWGVRGGVASLLLMLLSGVYRWDTDARGYALTVMFAALAATAWIHGRDRGWKPQGLLVVLLCFTTWSHYYGAFLALPFAFAEAFRTPRRPGRIALPLLGPGIALALSLPLLRGAQSYATVFWGRPSWGALAETYAVVFGPVLAIGVLVFGLVMVLEPAPSTPAARPPREELALYLGFLLVPIAAVAVTAMTTGAYAPRYALGSAIGLGPLVVIALAGLGLPPRWVDASLCLAGVLWVGREAREVSQSRQQALDLDGRMGWIARHSEPELPLLTWWGSAFLQISHYGPPALARRVRFVADPEEALRYEGENLSDRGMRSLAPWFPPGIVDLNTLARDYPRFVLYGETVWDGRWNWLTSWLLSRGWHVKAVAQNHNIWLFVVERPAGQ